MSLCPTRRRNLTAFVFAADPRFQKGESHVVHAFAGQGSERMPVVEMLKLGPVRRAHTCLGEGREPVSKALAQVLGTTKEFSYPREILARTSYLEP